MKNSEEFGYFAKDVAADIEITTSTLRRWSNELEKEGYTFQRNVKGQRITMNAILRRSGVKENARKSGSVRRRCKRCFINGFIKEKRFKIAYRLYGLMRLSRCELEEIVSQAVKEVKRDRENMFQLFEKKLDIAIERRDNFLMTEIQKVQEEKKQLIEEVAAAKEQEKNPFNPKVNRILPFYFSIVLFLHQNPPLHKM